MKETRVWSLGWEDPLEKEMATHSSTLASKIPWTEEPGRLQSMGLQSRTWLSNFTFIPKASYIVHACVLRHFSMPNSLWPCGLYPARLLCPWDSPSRNTGVGCSVLQGIFLTQGSNLHLSCIAGGFFYPLSHLGSPYSSSYYIKDV